LGRTGKRRAISEKGKNPAGGKGNSSPGPGLHNEGGDEKRNEPAQTGGKSSATDESFLIRRVTMAGVGGHQSEKKAAGDKNEVLSQKGPGGGKKKPKPLVSVTFRYLRGTQGVCENSPPKQTNKKGMDKPNSWAKERKAPCQKDLQGRGDLARAQDGKRKGGDGLRPLARGLLEYVKKKKCSKIKKKSNNHTEEEEKKKRGPNDQRFEGGSGRGKVKWIEAGRKGAG